MGRADVTLSARYTRRYSRFDQLGLSSDGQRLPIRDEDNVVTIGASIPIFGRNRNQGNVEAATARANAARLRREQLELTIPMEVAAAYRKWKAAQEVADVYDQGIVKQSTKNLAVFRQAYELGQLRFLDVLNEQRRLLETEIAYIDAKAEAARSLAELERAIGEQLP